ncbi:MAG: trypsin-like serine protease [Novosphingobium sp.]
MANREITIECTPGLPWIGLFFGHLWTSRNNSADGYDVRKRLRQSSGMQTDSVSPLSMSLRSTLFATMILACTTAFAAPGHGDVQHRAMAIAGGQKVEDFAKETPWHVGLILNRPMSGKPIPICGGTLIAADLILTAAHCFNGHDKSDIFISYGSNKWEIESPANVIDFVTHSTWSNGRPSGGRDLALIRTGPLKGTRTIPLAIAPPAEGASGKIAGWGGIGRGYHYADILRTASVSILSGEECPQAVGDERWALCSTGGMGPAQSTGGDICYGDSGGGLIVDGQLVGVVQGVKKGEVACRNPRHEDSQYTSIIPARDWISDASTWLRSQRPAAPKPEQLPK